MGDSVPDQAEDDQAQADDPDEGLDPKGEEETVRQSGPGDRDWIRATALCKERVKELLRRMELSGIG